MPTKAELQQTVIDRIAADATLAQYRSQLLYEIEHSKERYLQWVATASIADLVKFAATPLPVKKF